MLVKRLEEKMPRLMRGMLARRWRRKKRRTKSTPTVSGAHSRGLVRPAVEALEMPRSMPPNPRVESTREARSSETRSPGFSCGATISVAASKTSESTAVTAKRERQSPKLTKTPPSTGPTLGAKPSAMPAMPMPVALRCEGKRIEA